MNLQFSNLTKQFDGGKVILDHLNFSLPIGKFSGLLGPSGCGKTTLLRILAGLDKPSNGDVVIDGTVWTRSEDRIFVKPEDRNVGMVFQSYAVWPHMTVFENVAFPLRVRKSAPSIEIAERVLEILKIVGLDSFSSRMPNSLSGGQQQRVALARALVQRPQLLLLDEPLSNLDASLRATMRTEIRALQERFKITSIIVTHDWADAQALCDHLVVLKEGKIEQMGSPSEIAAHPVSDFVREISRSGH